MRIAFVVAGGVDPEGLRIVPHLVERFQALAAGNDVHVVALRQRPRAGRWSTGGATVWSVGRRPRRLRAVRRLVALHRDRPLDVIHGFGLVPQGVVAAVAGRLLGVPVVLEAPGGEFVAFPDLAFGGWRRAPGRVWIRLASALGGPVVVPSGPAAEAALQRGVAARRFPLEIDLSCWPRPAGPKRSDATARIAWIGNIAPVKGPTLFLDIAERIAARRPDVRFDVVGEDLTGGSFSRRASEGALAESVTLHGLLPVEAVRACLAEADILLVTSRFEAGPRTVLEAATQGAVAVGPRVGLLTEWAPDAAVVVDPFSPEAVAREVVGIIDAAPRRSLLAAAAAERVVQHSMPEALSRWDALYRAVVEDSP